MDTYVEFDSELFRPYLPDESQVSPGHYGAELAFWLSRKLAQRGVITSYPQREDWGWFIDYRSQDGHAYRLCCASRESSGDKWHCHVDRKTKSLFGRSKAPIEGAAPLIRALYDVLMEEQGIRNVSWDVQER
ncbi:hypothetical protein [Massilia consociata]|uniref:Uncharacterized protein n=1 Tax=Massilia consociata TaxID=760117 RepID=A0ABV6FAZ1_9BURK